jgi:hypothetical protein
MKNAPRASGKNYKEERRAIDTLMEFYIESKSEVEKFVQSFAVNRDEYTIEPFMTIPAKGFEQDPIKAAAETPKIEVVSH